MLKVAILVILAFLPCTKGKVDDDLQIIVDEYWEWIKEEFPEFATMTGDYRWNGQRQNYTLAAVTKRKTAAEGLLSRVVTLGERRKYLSYSSRITYDVLKFNLQTFVEGYEYIRSPQSLNPITYLDGPQRKTGLGGPFPFREKADYLDYLSRISKTKEQIGEMVELTRLAIKLGRTAHAVSIEPVPAQIDRILMHNATELSIYEPFNERLDNISLITQDEKEELRSEAIRIINDDYLEVFRQLKTFIEEEYLPNTRSEYGVSFWREDFYPACLKWHLSAEETPAALHNMGLAEVERISQKMSQAIARQGLGGLSISEYFTRLKENTTYQMSSVEEILETYTAMIHDRIDPNLSVMFKNLPNLPVVFLFDMLALAAHETNPGHHLQASYSLQIQSPPFRKHFLKAYYKAPSAFPTFTAYAEGWALYAESLLEEMGLYKDDAELMGRYSSEMYRACRLVVDTGIHAMGWSREEAIQYMLRYTSLVRGELESQVDRYITWPGQACAYKYGEMKIKELRKRAENKLGKEFDIKEFHSTVLDLGRVPLSVLEIAVDDWIERSLYKTMSGSPKGPTPSCSLLIISLSSIAFTRVVGWSFPMLSCSHS